MEVTINSVAYDVTDFAKVHPGGADVLEPFLGKDATDVFQAFHSKTAYEVLRGLPTAKASKVEAKQAGKEAPKGFDADMRDLRNKLVAEGMFRGSVKYFSWKVAELHFILAASALLLWYGLTWPAAAVLGLFFQQSGWCSHCFLHQAVFDNYRWNYLVGNFYLGNLCQGFSAHWWSTKHFRHHALPNGWLMRDGEVVVFDNDVNTAPFLLWCSYLESTIPELARRWVLPFQHLYALLLLCLAKASWNLASFTTAVEKRQWADVAGAVLHYAGFLGGGYWLTGGDVRAALTWFLGGMAIGGFLLGFVFIQSHNGTETLKGFEHGFFTSQMLTTRNVSTDALTTWFTGGLNYQIEHHLFPRLPRHNYGRVKGAVVALCKKHGIKYEELGLFESTAVVLHHLYLMGRPPKFV